MLTTTQVAEKWGCSRQRVLQLLRQGRIVGARKGLVGWLIPERVARPKNGKRGPKPA
jgi:hypothetical protein